MIKPTLRDREYSETCYKPDNVGVINLTVYLDNVDRHLLKDLGRDLRDVQEDYNLTTDTILSPLEGYVAIDIESAATTLPVALQDTLELLTDSGLSVYIRELGVN